MNSLLSIVVVSLFVVSASTTQMCKDLPKIRYDNNKETLQFGDSWRVIFSSQEDEKCFHFQYLKERNNDPKYATAYLISYKLGLRHAYTLRINNNMDQWRANIGTGSNLADDKYRKLLFEWENEAYCMYTCDDNGININKFRCDTTNKKGFEAIKRALAEYERKNGPLPFLTRPHEVWNDEECSKYSSSMPNEPLGLGNKYVAPDKPAFDDSNIGVNGKPDQD